MSYYDDIYEMPIYNWFKVINTGNLSFMKKDSTFKVSSKVDENKDLKAIDLWHDLNNQFMSEFGQSESALDLMEKKIDLGKLMAEYLITGNKFKLTQILLSLQI